MDGLSHVASTPITVEVGGLSLRLQAMTLGLLAELEQHIISQQVAALAKRLSQFTPEQQREILSRESISRTHVSQGDIGSYVSSFDGLVSVLWLLGRRGNPQMAELQAVREWCNHLDAAELSKLEDALARAMGQDALKNSQGQTQAEADQHESRGLASIVT